MAILHEGTDLETLRDDPPCPVCGWALSVAVVECLDCGSPSHQDCWDYAEGCSIFGCPGGENDFPRNRLPEERPPASSDPFFILDIEPLVSPASTRDDLRPAQGMPPLLLRFSLPLTSLLLIGALVHESMPPSMTTLCTACLCALGLLLGPLTLVDDDQPMFGQQFGILVVLAVEILVGLAAATSVGTAALACLGGMVSVAALLALVSRRVHSTGTPRSGPSWRGSE